ncbi:hypothetical protein Tsubulata_032018 [Turnera subulata]|uniref:DUF4283 domain-containing protein n=1 Tax=Turnera subulata TaxID=218843 RepID=A0A9Q0F4J2_9ROSI|nr:hypothetical protein Tsubulata_032018 [Turnera subulata]
MASASLLDANGLACEKSSLVLDLGRLQSPNSKLVSAKNAKGKGILLARPSDATNSLLGAKPTDASKPLSRDVAPPPVDTVLGLIHATSNKLWGRDGSVLVSRYKEEQFLFQFPNDAAYSRALNRGPWHVGGVPLLFRPWSSSSNKLDFSNAIFSVWVKLKNVPMELLTKEGLSYLSSVLGTPLHTDQDCSKIFRSDCVNVCIQIDFSKPLLNELKVDINGEPIIIDVLYSWKLPHCDLCHGWGHHELACPEKHVTKVWVPKKSNAPHKPKSPLPATEIIPQSSSSTTPPICSSPAGNPASSS